MGSFPALNGVACRAPGQEKLMTVHVEWLAHQSRQVVCKNARLLGRLHGREQGREFVAPEARDERLSSEDGAQAFGEFLDDTVANARTKGVVYTLKPVEIKQQDGQRPVFVPVLSDGKIDVLG